MSLTMLRTLLTAIGTAALFSGCAAPTSSVVGPANADKLRAVKTIAIATPLNVSYYTTTGAAPTVLFPGAGVIANIASGAVSGTLNAGAKSSTDEFNKLAVESRGGKPPSQDALDTVKAELSKSSFSVSEVDLAQDGAPKLKIDGYLPTMTGDSYRGADAIMVISLQPGYKAPGPLNSYRREVIGSITVFDSASLKPIFRKGIRYWKTFDEPSYLTYASLKEDLPKAIGALDKITTEELLGATKAFVAATHQARSAQ